MGKSSGQRQSRTGNTNWRVVARVRPGSSSVVS